MDFCLVLVLFINLLLSKYDGSLNNKFTKYDSCYANLLGRISHVAAALWALNFCSTLAASDVLIIHTSELLGSEMIQTVILNNVQALELDSCAHTHTHRFPAGYQDMLPCLHAFPQSGTRGAKNRLSERWRADHIQFIHYKENKERHREGEGERESKKKAKVMKIW